MGISIPPLHNSIEPATVVFGISRNGRSRGGRRGRTSLLLISLRTRFEVSKCHSFLYCSHGHVDTHTHTPTQRWTLKYRVSVCFVVFFLRGKLFLSVCKVNLILFGRMCTCAHEHMWEKRQYQSVGRKGQGQTGLVYLSSDEYWKERSSRCSCGEAGPWDDRCVWNG